MHRLPRHNIIRVFEGFAGYGGATFGLRRSEYYNSRDMLNLHVNMLVI